jgi:hypothetical protein
MWPTLVVGGLGFVAFRYRPPIALALCLFVVLLLSGLLIPAPISHLGTILDRPFVELWIFAPLSLLGAVGFAGLIEALGQRTGIVALAAAVTALSAHALTTYDPRASSCCTIVAPDDLVALAWLGDNVAPPDLVGIATETLQLGQSSYVTMDPPVDAGAWIQPLTGLGVVPLPANIDLSQAATREDLCSRGVRVLYIGGSGRGFDAGALIEQPAQSAVRLWLPQASVLELVYCRT